MSSTPLDVKAIRFTDSLTLDQEERGLARLEQQISSLWLKLEKSKPEVIQALSSSKQAELGKKVLCDIAGVAEVLSLTGHQVESELADDAARVRLTEDISKKLFARAEDIRDQVMHQGFSELSLPPRIDCADISDEHLGYGKEGSRYYVDVNPEVMTAPRDALKGGLSHEIAHVYRDSQLSRSERKLDQRNYKKSKDYRRRIERETDLSVVQRGLGESLLSFLDWLNDKGYKAHAGGGLKRKELRQMLRK